MYFNLANSNIKYAYPLAERVVPIIEKFYKESGDSDFIVEINTIEDLLYLDAACRATDNTYEGMIIKGTTIGLYRKGEFINDN